jgi:oligosaccharide translocation protein RFT1
MGQSQNQFGSSVRYLVYYQFLGSILNSLLQSIYLQLVSTELLGLINIQLSFISNVIFSFTREPYRKTSPRYAGSQDLFQKGKSLLWIGSLVAILQFIVSWNINPSWKTFGSPFALGFFLHSLAALIELGFEPYYAKVSSDYSLRKDVDTKVMIYATSLNMGAAFFYGKNIPKALIAFGISKILISSYYFYRYYSAGVSKIFVFESKKSEMEDQARNKPERIEEKKGEKLDEKQAVDSVFLAFFWDSCSRFFLAQGDIILMTALTDPKSQGLYSLLTNYASTLLRIVFTPLEESIRSYYSSKKNINDSTIFDAVFVFAQCSSFALFLFGTPYVDQFIDLVDSSKLKELNGGLAALYCSLLSLMILNGILEAYLHATSSAKSLAKMRRNSIILTLLYFTLSFYLLENRPDATSIVIANIFNFGMRIVQSLYSLERFPPLLNFKCLTIILSCSLICLKNNFGLEGGLFMGSLCLLAVLYYEKYHFIELKNVIMSK